MPNNSKKKILIIDDHPTILHCLKFILEDSGYLVETRSNCYSLFQNYTDLPDLLLLDHWMPGLNGGNMCLQLKSQIETQNIPIILMSADNKIENLTETVPVDDFIIKPFDIGVLLKKIDTHLMML